jgi:hypothetical protein
VLLSRSMAGCTAECLLQLRRVVEDPSIARGVIDGDALFLWHLLELTVAERIDPIPAYAQQDDRRLEMSRLHHEPFPLFESSVGGKHSRRDMRMEALRQNQNSGGEPLRLRDGRHEEEIP